MPSAQAEWIKRSRVLQRFMNFGMKTATAVLIVSLVAGTTAIAIGPETSNPPPPPTNPPDSGKARPDRSADAKAKAEARRGEKWLNDFWAAHALIQKGRYTDGIAALHALGSDSHADVANYLGYAHRKLGQYDDAKHWYEKALAADPNHMRTWQYYGMWHLEQGNRLKAEDHLAKIRTICGGTRCKEYTALKDALDGRIIY